MSIIALEPTALIGRVGRRGSAQSLSSMEQINMKLIAFAATRAFR